MRIRKVTVKMNGWRKPVEQITDRAKRYRANHPDFLPEGERVCFLCNSDSNVDVHHMDGDESNGARSNLAYACRSCNVRLGNLMRGLGVGRLTNQYNPSKKGKRGADALADYHANMMVMRGVWAGDAAAAIEHIRAAPASVRSAYTKRSWAIRRQRYGPAGRQSEIPF